VGVVGAWADLQFLADRLDPKTALVFFDVADNYFSRRSSSDAAKYAEAVRRISLFRRSSRFSRSNSAIRCALALAHARPPALIDLNLIDPAA
jgi:hypothetical protein